MSVHCWGRVLCSHEKVPDIVMIIDMRFQLRSIKMGILLQMFENIESRNNIRININRMHNF